MSLGSLLASPIIIINMGGEMLYILDQRLKAQKVDETKAVKVLQEVIQCLFLENFVDQLFEPQNIFSIQFTKQIFIKIAHCSIMKLNETSMNKLFDLMLMGLKHQICTANYPQEIY